MLLSTADEVRERQRRKIQSRITNEVLDLCDRKRQLKQQKCTSTEAALKYRKVNREVRKKMKTTKEERTEEQCKNIEKGKMRGNSKQTYNTLNAVTNQQSSKTAVETS